MKILIREGSAAKNFEALYPLIDTHTNNIMLCSDDKHPDSLLEGHINQLCARAVAKGIDKFNVMQAACINPIDHYKLPTGKMKVGDPANFIIVQDLISFEVLSTYINGLMVADQGNSYIAPIQETAINQFDATFISATQLKIYAKDYPNQNGRIPVIEAIDGTGQAAVRFSGDKGLLSSVNADQSPSDGWMSQAFSSNTVAASRTGPRTCPTPARAISRACKWLRRFLANGKCIQHRALKKSCKPSRVGT